MPCGGCRKVNATKFRWFPPEGSTLSPQNYNTEIEAKAKVLRKGGSYKPISG